MMDSSLKISLSPERLDEGSSEEKACFGLFSVKVNDRLLTEGKDTFINALRDGPLVSGYHVAAWLAWNWWRLRWEPNSSSRASEWWRAHEMSAIGEGYVWPHITIKSDGMRIVLTSDRGNTEPFLYAGAFPVVIPATHFETAVDDFMCQIQGKLRANGVAETNLDRIWSDVLSERRDPEMALRRKFEAMMGCDPDEGDSDLLDQLINDAKILGPDSIAEITADDYSKGQSVPTANQLHKMAAEAGFAYSYADRVDWVSPVDLFTGLAWQVGAQAAKSLRQQQKLDDKVITDAFLCELVGVEQRAISDLDRASSVCFALKSQGNAVFRSVKWLANRRFELARLLGDQLIYRQTENLLPATRSYTFRQKAQRAFAAAFLAPFQSVEEKLGDDYADEYEQKRVADYFGVSEMTIRTLLVNHKKLNRDDLLDFDTIAA